MMGMHRREFETWAGLRDLDTARSKNNPDRYADQRTHGAWMAWSHWAAHAEAAQPVAWALMQDGECIEVNTQKWITDAGLLEYDGEVVPLYAGPKSIENAQA